jgi:hypothetical protein
MFKHLIQIKTVHFGPKYIMQADLSSDAEQNIYAGAVKMYSATNGTARF